MQVEVHESIDEISGDDWNRLNGTDLPFLRHEFLSLAESSGSVAPECGWVPRHLAIYDGKTLRAAMPLYEKHHSWGEFVFDWAWANAYEQAGLEYYPKLVSCTPFTPATGRRLLLRNPDDRPAAEALLAAAVRLALELDYSSLHVQFPAADEVSIMESAGLLIRKDCQFHWRNRDYTDFENFLDDFSSRKRKKVRRERRRVREAGIRFRRLHGDTISSELWDSVYRLISHTFQLRGGLPYYSQAFFEALSRKLPQNLLVVIAEVEQTPVATALFFVADNTLYGRYWGSDGYYDSLHFETCYYQGIDYCIEHRLDVFEPGTQGEHKIARGFTPAATASAHWLAHPQFADAIERYLSAETKQIDRYIDAVHDHSPFRREPDV